VSNIRLIPTNLAVATGVVLKNGTGGGAPILDQLTAFPMTNALFQDRYTKWSTAAVPASPLQYDLDLGADKSIDAMGILGLRYVGTTDINTVTLKYASAAQGYNPAAWAGSTLGTITLANPPLLKRDYVVTVGNPVTARYLRFEFAFGTLGQFTLGKLLAGAMVDLGRGYSPNPSWRVQRVRLPVSAPTGQDLIVDLSDKFWTLDCQFGNAPQATRDSLAALADLPGTFVMLDMEDNAYECRLTGDGIGWADVFHPPYTPQLSVTSLP
jgi:hypothetical protein